MALETKKSISITGESKINGKQVIYLSANVTTNNAGNSNISQQIMDQELYKQNRVECRKDIDTFQDQVWGVEDGLLNENETDEQA